MSSSKQNSVAATITVRLTPKAKREGIEGQCNGALRASVHAPPVDGKANQALIELIAKRLGMAKSSVSIISGASSRNKIIRIEGIKTEEAIARLLGK